MRPCDVCQRRVMPYGGVCHECEQHVRETAATQWSPSYDAATARLNATVARTADYDDLVSAREASTARSRR